MYFARSWKKWGQTSRYLWISFWIPPHWQQPSTLCHVLPLACRMWNHACITGHSHRHFRRKSFTAKAGDVIFVNSGVLHSGIPQDCIYQCIVLIWTCFWNLIPSAQNICRRSATRSFWSITISMKSSLISRERWTLFWFFLAEEARIWAGCVWTILPLFRIGFGNHYYLESLRKTRRDYKRIVQLKQVVEFIEKNYASPITLQELSASVSMSPKYFCRFFSEMTHQTPMDYLNRQRIEQACCQLATTDDSITEIAYRNGFNDLSYFIRTFKKYKGITPGKYKRR